MGTLSLILEMLCLGLSSNCTAGLRKMMRSTFVGTEAKRGQLMPFSRPSKVQATILQLKLQITHVCFYPWRKQRSSCDWRGGLEVPRLFWGVH